MPFYMKRKGILSFVFALAAFESSADIIFKGGVLYVTGTAPVGTRLTLTKTTQGVYEIRPIPGGFTIPVIPQMTYTYTFAIGSLPPGPVRIAQSSSFFGPAPSVIVDIPHSDEKLLVNSTFNADGRFTFHVNGVNDVRYVVQKSSDFQNWTDLQTLVGESDFVAPEPPTESPIFYRIQIRQSNGDPLP